MNVERNPRLQFLPKLTDGKPLFGFVGHGFVGSAVASAFSNPVLNKSFIVDPKIGTTIDDLIEKKPDMVFVCAPTPSQSNGRIDATIVQDAVLKLVRHTDCGIVIKSTITPDVMDRILRSIDYETQMQRIIYSPEFLREGNAFADFLDPKYIVLGGLHSSCVQYLELCQRTTGIVVPTSHVHIMTHVEASFFKYAVNTFLATKVTFFNQLYDSIIYDGYGANPDVVMKALLSDKRMGNSHWRVPGIDGKRGFGGACFPKDLNAFINFTSQASLLEKVREINNGYRKEYELDEREVTNNIQFTDVNNSKETLNVNNEQTETEVKDSDISATLNLDLFLQ